MDESKTIKKVPILSFEIIVHTKLPKRQSEGLISSLFCNLSACSKSKKSTDLENIAVKLILQIYLPRVIQKYE